MTELAVVIVSFNTRDCLDACLRSLHAPRPRCSHEIVVVDNGSRDGSPARVRASWPAVRVIEAGRNLGYAAANNAGIRATDSELILLLNSDAEAPPGAPPELCEIGVLLAGDAAVAALNRRYRGREGATNVLAFPCAGPAPAAGAPRLLGDVVLARETVLAEARAAALPVADHVSHLVAHGVLHLLGYDHADAAGEAEMRGLEARALGRVGVPDPYRRRGGAPA